MIAESRIRQVSLAVQVISDLTFAPLGKRQFSARLSGFDRAPVPKRNGFVVFTNISPGAYDLTIEAPHYISRRLVVGLPLARPVLAVPGENEVLAMVREVEDSRVLFDPMVLTVGVPAGAQVLAAGGVSTRLAVPLGAGKVIAAQLESVGGLGPGTVLRLVRQSSLRLRHDPYAPVPAEITRIVGRCTDRVTGRPLAGVEVLLSRGNGREPLVQDVAGVQVATLGTAGGPRLLGFVRDLASITNAAGDYNLTLTADFLTGIRLLARRDGYRPGSAEATIVPGGRTRLDIALERA